MMPGMNGFQTFSQLQANPVTESIPTILLTTKSQTTKPEVLRRLGIKGIIPKPLDTLTLETDITRILDW